MNKKYFLGLIVLVGIIILVVVVVGQGKWFGQDLVKSLESKNFKLVEYNGQTSPGGGDYSLTFSEGVISAKFCNGLGGEYTLEDNVLQADLVGTLMYCETPIGLMEVESVFSRIVNKGAMVSLEDENLILTGPSGEELVFMAE